MKNVSDYYLQAFFLPISGSGEVDSFLDTDIRDEPKARQFIRTVIMPHFSEVEEERQDIMKESLRYYLTKGFDYERFWDSLQPSFGLPRDQRGFFLWVWEELFPGENPIADDLSGYVEESEDRSYERGMKYKRHGP